MGKKIAIGISTIVGLLLVLVVGSFIYFASNLDGIVKTMVETYGSEATGTKVSLGSVELDLSGGMVSFAELSVANPDGFKTQHAIRLAGVRLAVDPATLNKDLIVIKEIVIDEPVVTYEQAGAGSNLDQIKENVGRGDTESSEYTGPKIIIEKLTFTGGKVHVSADGVLNEDLSTELPAFTLYDIGKAQGGATPDEIAAEVTKGLTSEALGAVTDKGVETVLEKVLDGAGETVKDLKDGIGGLFKKDED